MAHLLQGDERRDVGDAVVEAIRDWMHARQQRPRGQGYQWKDVFLPDGTELMFRHQHEAYFAQVRDGYLMFDGQSTSPHAWLRELAGGKRNPWRDLYIRTSWRDAWVRAAQWRGRPASNAALAGAPDGSEARAA
jgi:hypothetical protein